MSRHATGIAGGGRLTPARPATWHCRPSLVNDFPTSGKAAKDLAGAGASSSGPWCWHGTLSGY